MFLLLFIVLCHILCFSGIIPEIKSHEISYSDVEEVNIVSAQLLQLFCRFMLAPAFSSQ